MKLNKTIPKIDCDCIFCWAIWMVSGLLVVVELGLPAWKGRLENA